MFAPLARTPRRARAFARFHHAGARFAASAWRHWFLDRHAEFWLGQLGSAWSASELRARVVEIVDETADTRTFVLAPNRHWPGHRAGQYVAIAVEIDGVRVRRSYSISSGASAPGDRIAITVKRVSGGRVSTWLHDRLRPGDVIGLGRPKGDFVVPATAAPLLLVAGGSGITPVIAILRDLEARDALRDVVVVHSAREDADAIFGRDLAVMATQQAGLRLVAHRTGASGRLDAAALAALVPDLAAREVYVCGPAGLRELVRTIAGDRVHAEAFTAPRIAAPPEQLAPCTPTMGVAPELPVTARTAQLRDRRVSLVGAGTVLEQLERAGEQPAHGCRIGVCHTCRCTKQRGTVLDLTTGRISSEPDEEIRLCVSIARSDLELAL